MAWLITLALFWGIGLFFAKFNDKITERHTQEVNERAQMIDIFLANVYILSWHYYQQMEPQVLQAWAEVPGGTNRDAAIPETPAFSYFSQQVFGREIHCKAIELAIRKLMEMQKIIMAQDGNGHRCSNYSKRLAPVKYGEFNFDSDTTYLWLHELPKLGDFYFWHFASKAHDPEIQQYIPQKTDSRVYQYLSPYIDVANKIHWIKTNRHGTPRDYEKSCCDLPKRDYKIDNHY